MFFILVDTSSAVSAGAVSFPNMPKYQCGEHEKPPLLHGVNTCVNQKMENFQTFLEFFIMFFGMSSQMKSFINALEGSKKT